MDVTVPPSSILTLPAATTKLVIVTPLPTIKVLVAVVAVTVVKYPLPTSTVAVGVLMVISIADDSPLATLTPIFCCDSPTDTLSLLLIVIDAPSETFEISILRTLPSAVGTAIVASSVKPEILTFKLLLSSNSAKTALASSTVICLVLVNSYKLPTTAFKALSFWKISVSPTFKVKAILSYACAGIGASNTKS